MEQTRLETTETAEATVNAENRTEEEHETILTEQTTRTEETTGVTVTEIEIYDTTLPADPVTGLSPIRARVSKRHDASGTVRTMEQSESKSKGETKAEASVESSAIYNGGELAELTVIADKPPTLWDRIKQGSGGATALILLVAVGWMIFKLKKR